MLLSFKQCFVYIQVTHEGSTQQEVTVCYCQSFKFVGENEERQDSPVTDRAIGQPAVRGPSETNALGSRGQLWTLSCKLHRNRYVVVWRSQGCRASLVGTRP